MKKLYEEKEICIFLSNSLRKKISKVTSKLDKKRSCQEHDLQVKWIKSNKDLFSQFIYHSFNSSLFSFNFFSSLKLADILPTRKKKNMSDIKNYPPVIIIPMRSRIYERYTYERMYKYFDQILSKYRYRFCRGYNTQNCLLVMVEKWKDALDKGDLGGAQLTGF